MPFQLESSYKPRGDQGQAIAKLLKSVEAGNRHQTLLGVTGSGKTFTIANVIQELDRPTLVISHNKTLAAQLYSEFKQFFPRNAVEYFVSYFDYYQPEAYIPRSDTYIEKDSSINEEIERLRLAATSALLSRRDTIVVASVSCIYGITSPEDYLQMLLTVKQGQHVSSNWSRKTNSWKRNACGCARNTTWKCCRKWGSATGLRITRAICPGARLAPSRTRSSTSFRKIFW